MTYALSFPKYLGHGALTIKTPETFATYLAAIHNHEQMYTRLSREVAILSNPHQQWALEKVAADGHTKMVNVLKASLGTWVNLDKVLDAAISGGQLGLAEQLISEVYKDDHSLFIKGFTALRQNSAELDDKNKAKMQDYLDAKLQQAIASKLASSAHDFEAYKKACKDVFISQALANQPLYYVSEGPFRIILTWQFQGPAAFLRAFLKIKLHAVTALAAIASVADMKESPAVQSLQQALSRSTIEASQEKDNSALATIHKAGELIGAVPSNPYDALLVVIESDVEYAQAAQSLSQSQPDLAQLIKQLPRKALERSLMLAAQGNDKAEYLKIAKMVHEKRNEFPELADASTKNDDAFAVALAAYYGHKDMYLELVSDPKMHITLKDLQLALDLAVKGGHRELIYVIVSNKIAIVLNQSNAFRFAVQACDKEMLTLLIELYPQQFITMREELEGLAVGIKTRTMTDAQKDIVRDVVHLVSAESEDKCLALLESGNLLES